jgi:hypothetical protein
MNPPVLVIRSMLAALLFSLASGCTSTAQEKASDKGVAFRVLRDAERPEHRFAQARLFTSAQEAYAALLQHVAASPRAPERHRLSDPRRFFGRWLRGSHLSANTVIVTGSLAGPQPIWYLGDYFADVPAEQQRIYSQYFGPLPTPPQLPPVATYEPGRLPAADAFTELRFTLDAIRASDRYGGSLELIFNPDVGVEYELRRQNTMWDMGTLTMHVFVRPRASMMNPLGPPQLYNNYHPVKVEFVPDGVTAYTVSSAGTSGPTITRDADPRVGDLTTALRQLGDGMEQATPTLGLRFKNAANNLAHAWLHVQHLGLFDPNQSPPEKVTSIELADQHSFLRTESPTIHVSWWVRIFNTSGPPRQLMFLLSADQRLPPEVSGSQPVPVDGPVYGQAITSFEMSRRFHVGTFPADECADGLPAVLLGVDVRDGPEADDPQLQQSPEAGPLFPATTSAFMFTLLSLNCGLLQNYINTVAPPVSTAIAPNRLLYLAQDQGVTLLSSSGAIRGSYTIFVEAILTYL